MSKSILISSDSEALARWLEAFPAAAAFAEPQAAVAAADADSIVWLHLPHDPAEATNLLALSARLLAPARIVALSDTPDDAQALALMQHGAVGYCHSLAGATMLRQVATVVGNRGLWVGPGLLQRMIRASLAALPDGARVDARLDALSVREREVAAAVGRGASNKEIARELAITERTVKAHLGAIFVKLGVRDRLQLALLMRGRDSA